MGPPTRQGTPFPFEGPVPSELLIDRDGTAGFSLRALARELDPTLTEATQITFLGRSWTTGLAHEAALKLRESAGGWTESYPTMEYRHGPIAVAQAGRVTWMLGEPPSGLADEVAATGAWFESGRGLDPMAELVVAQRVALAHAIRRGLDPDRPRSLCRAVVLNNR